MTAAPVDPAWLAAELAKAPPMTEQQQKSLRRLVLRRSA